MHFHPFDWNEKKKKTKKSRINIVFLDRKKNTFNEKEKIGSKK